MPSADSSRVFQLEARPAERGGGAGAGDTGGEPPEGQVAGVDRVPALTGGGGAVAHPTTHSDANAKLQWRNQHRVDPIMIACDYSA